VLARVVFALLTVPIFAVQSEAKDCPVTERPLDAQTAAISRASSCKEAYATMSSCASGASGDVALGEAVRQKCEPLFLGRLSAAQRRAYTREQRACSEKYARQSGTMYLSMAAFCQAASTVRRAARYQPSQGRLC
jgi:hypothetical protein